MKATAKAGTTATVRRASTGNRPVTVAGLILALCFLLSAPVLGAGDDRDLLIEKARRLSRDEKYEEAKSIYRQLLKRNPRDIEAAIGLATVTAWSGEHDQARQLYEETLKHAPGDRDALLGLGRVLFWQGHHEQSLETLDRLLVVHPDDKEALEQRERVLRAQEAIRHFKARWHYRHQDLSFAADAQGTNLLISFEESRRWGVRAGFNFIDKFGDAAPGFRLGGTYWATKDTALSLDMEFAPGQEVVPRQAYTVEISQALFKRLVPSLSYRFADYSRADVHMVMPGLSWYFHPRFVWIGRYFLSISQFSGLEFTDHSGMTRLNWNATDPLTLFVGYARANESFESGNPVDPFAGFSADHLFTGFSWEIYRGVGIEFTFDYEERDNGFTLETYDVGIVYRW